MKILQVTEPGNYRILNKQRPEPEAKEVLMKVEAVATCPQWDLHLKNNEPMFVGHNFHYPYTPGQPGHEASGEVIKVGKNVTSFSAGDKVSAWRDPGHDTQGCYAQYVIHKEDNLIKIPEDSSYEKYVSVELAMCLGTVFMMLKEMKVIRNKILAVMGLGPAGLIAVQIARAEGAKKVIGFDFVKSRREKGLVLGADEVYDPKDNDLSFGIRPEPADIETAIDCVGAQESVHYIMDRTSDVVALFGVQRQDYIFSPRHYNGLRLCGYKGHSKKAAEYAISIIKKGSLDLEPLLTHYLSLEDYDNGLELLEKKEALKVCFLPWN